MNQLLLGFALMSVCVAIHLVGGLNVVMRVDRRAGDMSGATTVFGILVMVRMFMGLMLLHLLQIILWGLLYTWQIDWDLSTALYFSTVTYATIGYGDVVPPPDWRLAAAIEGLTGVLMLGWSSALIFVVVSRMYAARTQPPS